MFYFVELSLKTYQPKWPILNTNIADSRSSGKKFRGYCVFSQAVPALGGLGLDWAAFCCTRPRRSRAFVGVLLLYPPLVVLWIGFSSGLVTVPAHGGLGFGVLCGLLLALGPPVTVPALGGLGVGFGVGM